MASRRDLIQGYQFAARRVVSAVVMRQTDPSEWPFRRLAGAGFGTIMLTVIALAAVAVYGLIFPGGKTSWQDGRSVIVEKETGARYVYIDGRLHPVLNFASAALLVGSPQVTATSHASLVGIRRGVTLGIPGAPDALPTESDLVAPPWSLCTEQTTDDRTGNRVVRTALTVSRAPGSGTVAGDRAILVSDDADGQWYLVWRNHRYQLTGLDAVRVALGLDNDIRIPAGDAWLQALPAGQSIGPIHLAGAGGPSRAVSGARIGQVLVVHGASDQAYLADAQQLIPLSSLQTQVQVAEVGSPAPRELSPADAGAAPKAPVPLVTAESPPERLPDFVRPPSADTVLCAAYQDGSFNPTVLVGATVPAGGGLPTVQVAPGGVPLADRVWVPPGSAEVVAALPSPTAPTGPLYLITDNGWRYAIPDTQALHSLGYSGDRLSRLAAALVVRIPEGPALDPRTARAALANEPTN
jgi:type VII secretion protein EccB